jgi:dTDP-glucose pyrophosphorylase
LFLKKPELVIMAAGMGSRYGGLKQIDPVGPSGEIIIDYSVYDALRAGFGKVIIIIRKDIEDMFRDSVGKRLEKHADIEYVFQELNSLPAGFAVPEGRTKPWGTGHALLCSRGIVTAPFAVINADDFYGASSYSILSKYLTTAADKNGVADFCMVAYKLSNTLTDHGHVARGVCEVGNDDMLKTIVEHTKIERHESAVRFEEDSIWHDINPETLVSMNMFGFTPVFLDALNDNFPDFLIKSAQNLKAEYFMPSVVNNLIQQNKATVNVLSTNEKWLGVTYREDKPMVQKAVAALVASGAYPENLW